MYIRGNKYATQFLAHHKLSLTSIEMKGIEYSLCFQIPTTNNLSK